MNGRRQPWKSSTECENHELQNCDCPCTWDLEHKWLLRSHFLQAALVAELTDPVATPALESMDLASHMEKTIPQKWLSSVLVAPCGYLQGGSFSGGYL